MAKKQPAVNRQHNRDIIRNTEAQLAQLVGFCAEHPGHAPTLPSARQVRRFDRAAAAAGVATRATRAWWGER